jgi:hypothetical protein
MNQEEALSQQSSEKSAYILRQQKKYTALLQEHGRALQEY